MARRLCGLLLVSLAMGCTAHPTAAWADITTALTPPPAYARWWQELESCTGLRGDFSAVRWEMVAGEVIPREDGGVAGIYFRGRRVIQLAESWVGHSGVVKHEMLHALTPGQRHTHWGFAVRNICGVTPFEHLAWAPDLDHDLSRGPAQPFEAGH